jgi:sulfur-oxidizing protein SoxX
VSTAISAVALIGAIGFSATVSAEDKKDPMAEGKKLAFDKKKGNCLACHLITGGDQPGNIAPPLIGMKARFPDKAKLHAQVAEPRTANPNSMMPPFSAHGVLSEKEIDLVVDFIYSL